MPLDPITTEIISNRLREVAATMEHVLYHSGYSPILRESRDGSSGLTDANGRVLVVGGGIQIHSIPYQQAVNGIIARYGRERLAPGQTYIVNDPYQAGNPHLPDMVTVTPVFYGDRLIGFGVSIAHKADIGGIVPGSSGGAAREIWHDGLNFAAAPLSDRRCRQRGSPGDHPRQQPHSRCGDRRSARSDRQHAARRRAPHGAVR